MSCKLLCEKCNQEIDLEKVFLDDTKYGMVGISDSMMIYRYVICNHCLKINLLSESQAESISPLLVVNGYLKNNYDYATQVKKRRFC